MTYRIEPTAERFSDLEDLFGTSGAFSGCWCMWNRQTNAEFQEQNYEPNRESLRANLAEGHEFGILAFDGETPVGWAALAPRGEYSRLSRSPVTKPVDDTEVWSVTCFVVRKGNRGQGVARALLAGAEQRARELGAAVLEGYPVAPDGDLVDTEAWHGLESMFVNAGFTEVARRKPRRPMYRKTL
ncbi:MAG: GNAT family N-acetyltransferase [Acidimicrobiia bacterium]|nr:GNAT family N-acetyltransferase [Acidimicrobiia bacterium]